MNDLGHKLEAPTDVGKEKYYPSLSFTTEEIPELKGKKIGDKIKFDMVGEIKGLRENDKEISYDVEFHKCDMQKMSKDEYMKMSDEEKDKEDEKEILSEEE